MAIAVAVALVAWGVPVEAQSITRGGIVGSVTTAAGNPMWDARVILTDTATGVQRVLTTPINGRFAFNLLVPSDYELRFEKIGYQPKRLVLAVRARRIVTLPPVELPLVPLPVTEIVDEPFAAGAAAAGQAGTGQWVGSGFAEELPGERRPLTDVTRFLGFSDRDFRSLGLPSGEAGFVVEGIGLKGASHPDLAVQQQLGAMLPLSGFQGAEMIVNGADVEFGGVPGGMIVGYPRRGTREFSVTGFADLSADALATASDFEVPKYTSGRAAVALSGPIVRDTTHFVAGLEWVRTEAPRPRAWEGRTTDAALLAAADSFGVDLGPYTSPSVATTDVLSGFGRIDANLGTTTTVTLTTSAAVIRDTDVDLGPDRPAGLGGTLDGVDVMAVGTVASGGTGGIQQEVRLGFETSEREYGGGTIPSTSIVEDGIRFGFDETLPGTFRRTAVSFTGLLFAAVGSNHAKLGFGGVVSSHSRVYAPGTVGTFRFGDVAAFARNEGLFSQGVGTPGDVSYTDSRFYWYLQNAWVVSPRLQLSFGMRVDLGWLPTKRVPLNTDWQDLTGLTNNGMVFTVDSAGTVTVDQKRARWSFSPRLGLVWDLGPRREWTVSGGLGLYFGEMDPALFSDLAVRDGLFAMRRGDGVLGAWPLVPDSTVAPVRGPSLAVLYPDYEVPRTFGVSVGIARDLGDRTSFHVTGVYRHVDYLTRIDDLNRPVTPASVDQDDRSIWGQLVQQGPLIYAAPGTNRRFQSFDRVTALNPDGYVDYLAVSVGFDRQMGGALRFLGQYTFSRTTDNWLGSGLGGIERRLSPFPAGGLGQDWAEGTSDLDVPHRVTAGLVLGRGRFPFELTAFYRFASGRPFTPGYPDGVDVNGDGSGFNDPAFIDPNAPGMNELFVNSCLSFQRGRFAERNSCRAPATHRLDLRLAIPLIRAGRFPLSIVVDGLNLAASKTGLVDRAVYRIDPAGSLTTSPDGTRVTVPVVVNPDFGQFVVRTDRGRFVRLGVRLGLR